MGPIAQSVEQRTFNPWVDSSSLSGPTHLVQALSLVTKNCELGGLKAWWLIATSKSWAVCTDANYADNNRLRNRVFFNLILTHSILGQSWFVLSHAW